MRVGVVGLGIMGRAMARNLLEKGFAVAAYNRSPEPRAAVVAAGARPAATPAAAAHDADAVLVSVGDSPDVEAVCLGPGGIVEGARPGTVVVDASTIAPAVARRVGAALAARGIGLLDAPVSGGERGAIAGTLVAMVGGEAADLDRARPVLEAVAARIVHCGPLGAGQTVKLCNQIAVALNNLGTCEALVFAERHGVDPARVLEALGAGAAASWQLEHLGPQILARDFSPGFRVRLQAKDLRLAEESARAAGASLPGLALVHRLFAALERAGAGEEGTQALVKSVSGA